MLKDIINAIWRIRYLEVPKAEFACDETQYFFGAPAQETRTGWLVPCTRLIRPAASADEIKNSESQLGFRIPAEYRKLLSITNGAELFITSPADGSRRSLYPIFDCERLANTNRLLLDTFKRAYANDEEYKNCTALNYLAVCESEDGDYQAMLLDPPWPKRVFLLFHEFTYRPYSNRDKDFCHAIADSLADWLQLLLETGGWEGRGRLPSGD